MMKEKVRLETTYKLDWKQSEVLKLDYQQALLYISYPRSCEVRGTTCVPAIIMS